MAENLGKAAGVSGGLCVLVACNDSQLAADLAGTGRFLVHVIDSDPGRIDAVRARLREAGVYGLASAELLDTDGKLPYTENRVNALFVGQEAAGATPIPEMIRVLVRGAQLSLPAERIIGAGLTAAGMTDVPGAMRGSSWKQAQ